MATHTPDPRGLRVSDAEREHVTALLQKAVGRGLLTLEEFAERTDTALAARTRGELNAVLADLPGLVHAETAAPAPPERLELKTTMSATRRRGDWHVPGELVIRNRMGATDLDFTEARIPHRTVHLRLDVAAGSVRLLVPWNATVSSEDVEVLAGKLTDRTGYDRRGNGTHFAVTGNVRAGSVEIRRPWIFRLGGLVVQWPFRISWSRP
ncbi:DUF1707 SHOCT-like domain-containing protein [Amycolatopsis anabasis]|uniref:DUF1707 SHOCT-like domain-containing protein n=1 Tax=Amycolatopsis anabasis TaxID=1840409 RepID=UPI00131B693C|nr:DUF1707 domain-containing protein [Amycolatopsis anabasis]